MVISGYGVGGPIPAKLGYLPQIEISIGLSPLFDVPSRLPETSTGFFATSDFGGSIGNGLLQNYHVSFNYRDSELILNENSGRQEQYVFIAPKILDEVARLQAEEKSIK